MLKTKVLLALLGLVAAPVCVAAAQTQPPAQTQTQTQASSSVSVPDGTYVATVQKVVDGKHMTIKMQNGSVLTVTTNRSNVDFSKVHANTR